MKSSTTGSNYTGVRLKYKVFADRGIYATLFKIMHQRLYSPLNMLRSRLYGQVIEKLIASRDSRAGGSMQRTLLTLSAIVLAAAVAMPAASAASRNGKQCDNFFDCLFGGINNSNGDRSRPSFGGGANYGPSTRSLINFPQGAKHKTGTIIVDTSERNLYFIQPGGKAYKYRVGVGRQGFQWSGSAKISRKAEWPSWTPPKTMIAREKKKGIILPARMEGGPNNPLGARSLYIGSSLYRIHGTNNPSSIGGAVSSGCIRLTNTDIIDLHKRAHVGAKVIVRR
jgi:lipoprotein-anchoring transpeptidase ErfK/SrfK